MNSKDFVPLRETDPYLQQRMEREEKYTEIVKLHDMMEERQIPHDVEARFGGYHIAYPGAREECICSIIEHDGSYGRDRNLVEIMGLCSEEELGGDDVLGFLTAEDVLERVSEDWKERTILSLEDEMDLSEER